MPRITKEDAQHSLEDLEVREVSIVDRPANKRRFLVVKSDTEENMPNQVTTVDLSAEGDSAAVELLGFLEEGLGAPPTESLDLDGLEVIFKATTAGQALKALTPILQKLMDAVSEMKKLKDGDSLTDRMVATVKAVRTALDFIAGGKGDETEETKKADAGVKGAALALQTLTVLVNKLKDTEADRDLSDDEVKEVQKISLLLSKVSPDPKKDKKGDKKDDGDKEAAQKAEEEFGPIIVLKAGAKMRKARLNQLKKAVEILTLVLKELEDAPPDDKKDEKDKKRVKKEDAPDPEVEALKKQVGDLKELLSKSEGARDDLAAQLDKINKRLDEIADTRPLGEGDGDPPVEVKKKESLWAGIIR